MDEPLVSIIVNNHNYARFLGAALDSALAQTHSRVEIVVVDDGSDDDSRGVIASYGRRVIAVLKENGGQGSAFNAGFAASRGEILNFLDADDVLEPDAAARAVGAIAQGVVHWRTPLALIDARGRPLGRDFPSSPLPEGDLRERVLSWGPWSYQVSPNTGNFWARAYVEKVLPMPEQRFRIGGDEYLSALAPLYGRLASSPVPCGRYRVHGANHYWRRSLGVQDLADDAFFFQRIAELLVEHAARLGLEPRRADWERCDWRQQVRFTALFRAGLREAAPGLAESVRAVLADQTRPLRKAMLLPLVGLLHALPRQPSIALALRLLAR